MFCSVRYRLPGNKRTRLMILLEDDLAVAISRVKALQTSAIIIDRECDSGLSFEDVQINIPWGLSLESLMPSADRDKLEVLGLRGRQAESGRAVEIIR